jgi:hypothetical protein
MAFTLIGGTLGGTVVTLVFLPALYALWYRITPDEQGSPVVGAPPYASSEIHADAPRPQTA